MHGGEGVDGDEEEGGERKSVVVDFGDVFGGEAQEASVPQAGKGAKKGGGGGAGKVEKKERWTSAIY